MVEWCFYRVFGIKGYDSMAYFKYYFSSVYVLHFFDALGNKDTFRMFPFNNKFFRFNIYLFV